MLTETGIDGQKLDISQAKQRLLRLCKEIVADGVVDQEEAVMLETWLNHHEALLAEFPANVIAARLFNHLDDHKLDKREAENLLGLLRRVIREEESAALPQKSLPYDMPPPQLDLATQHLCLAGQFALGTTTTIGSDIKRLGGTVTSAIESNAPTVLVIGYVTGRQWLDSSVPQQPRTLIDTAISARAKGRPVMIISEEHLMDQMICASGVCID